jgi:hypothetical protein
MAKIENMEPSVSLKEVDDHMSQLLPEGQEGLVQEVRRAITVADGNGNGDGRVSLAELNKLEASGETSGGIGAARLFVKFLAGQR